MTKPAKITAHKAAMHAKKAAFWCKDLALVAAPLFVISGLFAASLFAPAAHADYAVLRSGVRLHITGYEQVGDRVRLTVEGGVVEVAATELASVEPEDNFQPLPPAQISSTAPFAQLIHASAQKNGVDEKLITHVIAAESNFNPRAVSRKQALGLMQLLPTTARDYLLTDVFDPAQNIDAGTRYLKSLLERYRGNLSLALAAYNAGPETVDRYGGIPPFPETRQYVHRITTLLSQSNTSPAKN